MAKIEDYLPEGKNYSGPEVEVITDEIEDASKQQEDREKSTPEINWEKRYKDMEVAYSRQGQQMGDYRKLIDDYVTTTPDNDATDSSELSPITPDDMYENPAEAVARAVDAHPAIQRVQALEKELQATKVTAIRDDFESKHPDYLATLRTSEFANWVKENSMRQELAQRADQFDMTAADALFTLYQAESATQIDESGIEEVGLETGTGAEPPAPERFSRSEMLNQKIRAKQGDPDAREYVRRTAVAYREALGIGNVRD